MPLIRRALARRAGDEWFFALAVVFLAVLPALTGRDFSTLNTIANIAVLAIAVLGMNLVLGIGGQFWLGQSALFALGGYGTGILMVHHGWAFWPAAAVVIVATGLVGAILGIPGLRLGGFYLALATFFFASIIPEIIDALSSQTGGAGGLVGVASPSIAGTTFGIVSLYGLTLAALLAVFLLNFNLLRAQWGRVLLTVGHDENLARSVGVRLWQVKMVVYFVGALPVGLAGALYAGVNNVVLPGEVNISLTITFLAAVVIGGSGTLAGPIVGIALLQWLPTVLTGLQTYTLIGYGVVLYLVMIFAPQGLFPTARQLVREATRRGRRAVAGLADRQSPRADASEARTDGGRESAPVGGEGVAPARRPLPEAWARPAGTSSTVADGAPMLVVRSVSKHFGGVAALSEVSLEVAPGGLCAIIGPNGSGKTTLLNIITGFYAPNAGTVSVAGREIAKLGPHGIAAKLGVRRSFQTAAVVPTLSVLENVLLGFGMPTNTVAASCVRWPTVRRTEREMRRRAEDVLGFVGLGGLGDLGAGNLPAGQRRLLEIARSLIALPQLLLLDEPSSGLNPAETTALGELLHEVIGLGVAVAVVEHNMNFVLTYASSVLVLDQGQVAARGTPEEIARDPEVRKAYLGSQVAT